MRDRGMSLHWHGRWALQLWGYEPDVDGATELLKRSFGPDGPITISLEVRARSRIHAIVVAHGAGRLSAVFRCEQQGTGLQPHRDLPTTTWEGSNRFTFDVPADAERIVLEIGPEDGAKAKLRFTVAT